MGRDAGDMVCIALGRGNSKDDNEQPGIDISAISLKEQGEIELGNGSIVNL